MLEDVLIHSWYKEIFVFFLISICAIRMEIMAPHLFFFLYIILYYFVYIVLYIYIFSFYIFFFLGT